MDEKQTFVERPFQSSNIASADGRISTVAAAAQARNNQLLILNIILDSYLELPYFHILS